MKKGVVITLILLVLSAWTMAMPIQGQAPTRASDIPVVQSSRQSTLTNIYDDTVPMPEDVCYRADGSAMFTAEYSYYFTITYTNTQGDTLVLKYFENGFNNELYLVKKIVITVRQVKPTCALQP